MNRVRYNQSESPHARLGTKPNKLIHIDELHPTSVHELGVLVPFDYKDRTGDLQS